MRLFGWLIPFSLVVFSAVAQEPDSELKSASRSGAIYWSQGRYDEAELFYKRVVDLRAQLTGRDDLEYAGAVLNHAKVLERLGRGAQAAGSYREVLDLFEKLLGPRDPRVALVAYDLGMVYVSGSQLALAEPLLLQTISILEETHGSDRVLAEVLAHLADLYARERLWVESEKQQLRSLDVTQKAFGAASPEMASRLCALAKLYVEQDQPIEADHTYVQALSILEREAATEHANPPSPRSYVYRTLIWSGATDADQPSAQVRSTPPVRDRIAGCLSGYASWLRHTNREPEAKLLEQKATNCASKERQNEAK